MTYGTKIVIITTLLALVCLQVPLSAQQQASYFPNVLVVKFETNDQLRSLKNKTGQDPRQQVRIFLNLHGGSSLQPLLDAGDRQRIRSKAGFDSNPSLEELGRIYQARYLSGADPAVLAAKISQIPGVEYAEPKYVRYMQEVPNDPIINPYVDFHNFAAAWDITHGRPEVVIAIVDGGVGYLHPELDEKMWINSDEIPGSLRAEVDRNGDGLISSGEVQQYLQDNNEDNDGSGNITLEDALHPASSLTTGSDTDGNGFDDDLFGWNFWASGDLTDAGVEANNNPLHDATDHGTHVAGIAAAETNNGQGIAATGYDVRYMAVKAGGTPNEPTAIGFGFEGILYAAEAGADIINCSWGGSGFSQFEQDVIDFAVSMGSLVVAAAGNEGSDRTIFPAAFPHVLGVGSVETNNRLSQFSNYGYRLDVLATGSSVRSTVFDGDIESKSGTSMSTPVVSGLAGLIKSIHPDWSPLRIATHIRATSTPVVESNPQRSPHKLGRGKVNAREAVNTEKPGLMVEAVEFINLEGEKLALGEAGLVRTTLVNYGSPTQNLVVNILPLTQAQNISLDGTTRQLGSLGTNESVVVEFSLILHEEFNLDDTPVFRVNFEDNSADYRDFSILQYDNILFDVVDANNVIMSLAANGTIGFTELGETQTGVGFIPREPAGSGDNLLFEGGVMMLANGQMYDAVRSTGGRVSRDFQPEQVFRTITPGTVSEEDGFTRFSVSDSSSGTFADIELETYAFDDPGLGNVVYLKYTVTNTSKFVRIEDMYLGVFNDWDIGSNPSRNGSSFNAQDSILYVFDDSESSEQPIVAAAHLGPISSLLGINNAREGRRDSVLFGIYDGYTDEEKKISLQAGVAGTELSGADVSAVSGSGPYTLNPQGQVVVGFVYAFGSDLSELRNQIQNARAQAPFQTSATGLAVSEQIPPTTRLFQNYPNPFERTTSFRLDLQEPSDVKLTIYDVLGRKVSVLVDQQLEARTHIFTFTNQQLSSGVYFVRLQANDEVQTVPITLIR